MNEEQMKQVLALIEQELDKPTTLASAVLFGDELGSKDWTPEDAVETLFKYATKHGWNC